MAMRQYIGARYVPKYSEINEGIWDNTYSYEALIIVKHGNDFYTSRKPVPVGTPITNTEYWIKTGDYNGAVADLDAKIQQNTTNISAIGERLTTAENNINSIMNKEIILIGDSWLDPQEGGNTVVPLLEDMLNYNTNNIHNFAVGGSGFIRTDHLPFLTQLNNAVNDTSIDKKAVDCIICYGGVNDGVSHSATDFANVINAMTDIINVNFPNAKFYVFFMQGNRTVKYPLGLIQSVIRNSKANVINAAWAIPYTLYADNLHPTATGYHEVARFIACTVQGGHFEAAETHVSFTSEFNAQFAGTRFTAQDINLTATWDETKVTVSCYMNVNNDSSISTSPFGTVTIPTLGIPTLFFLGNNNPIHFTLNNIGIGKVEVQLAGNTSFLVNARTAPSFAATNTIFYGSGIFTNF